MLKMYNNVNFISLCSDIKALFIYFEFLLLQVSIMQAIKSQLKTNSPKMNKKLTFKQSRAKKQHLETLKLIEETKKNQSNKNET